VHLNQRLLTASPREVPVRRRDGDEAADRQLLARALIELLAHADEEHAGEHGHVLAGLVEVRRDLVVGRELHAIDEEAFLARIALDDRELGPRERRRVDPFQRVGRDDQMLPLLSRGRRHADEEHDQQSQKNPHGQNPPGFDWFPMRLIRAH